MVIDPVPQPLFSGFRRHIARPDHPRGTLPTNVAFCGAVETPSAVISETSPPSDNLPVCKRCSVAWVAYVDRLARERAIKKGEDL